MVFRVRCGFVLCVLLASPGCLASDLKDARRAAVEWLQLLDEAEYRASWHKTALPFRAKVSSFDWQQIALRVRDRLGQFKRRTFISARFMKQGGNKHFVSLRYRTSFANKVPVVETVTHEFVRGEWRVTGYEVR